MKILRAGAVFLLVAGLLFLFFLDTDLGRVWVHVRRVNPVYLLAFALGLLLQQVFRGYRWALILRPRQPGIRIRTLVHFTLIGFVINTVLPGRIGEPARGILVARKEGFKSAHGLASVVLERLIDLVVVACLFLVSMMLMGKNSTAPMAGMHRVATFLLPAVMAIFPLFYLMNRPGGFAWIRRQVNKLVRVFPARRRERMGTAIMNFVEGLHLKMDVQSFLLLVLSSFAIWLCVVPTYWLLFRPLGIHVTLLQTLVYYCILVAAASIPTPGMAGSLDAASKMVLVSMLGVEANRAVAYTLVMHMLIILVLTGAGFIALAAEGIHLKGIRRIQEAE